MTQAYAIKWTAIVVADSPEEALKEALMDLKAPENKCVFVEVWEGGIKVALVDIEPYIVANVKAEHLQWV